VTIKVFPAWRRIKPPNVISLTGSSRGCIGSAIRDSPTNFGMHSFYAPAVFRGRSYPRDGYSPEKSGRYRDEEDEGQGRVRVNKLLLRRRLRKISEVSAGDLNKASAKKMKRQTFLPPLSPRASFRWTSFFGQARN